MSNFKGTKGKWTCTEDDEYSDVYNVFCTQSSSTFGEQQYNALLISKAPELLDMLERAIEEIIHLKHEYKDTGHCVKFMNEAEKLIKEATEL